MVRPPETTSLLDRFAALKDPRQFVKVLYPLPEVLLLVLCATIVGADDFVEVQHWGELHLDFLRRFLPYKHGIPSHDALNDLMNALNPRLFAECFITWVNDLRDSDPDIVAIDGKTSRGTHAKSKGRPPLHLVSAWASRQRLVLGQEATDVKSNEVTAIPLLLQRLELKGALVTPRLRRGRLSAPWAARPRSPPPSSIAAPITCSPSRTTSPLCTITSSAISTMRRPRNCKPTRPPEPAPAKAGADHGRIEGRRHVVSHNVDWLAEDSRFPGIKSIAMVENTVERNGETSCERRYYICSLLLLVVLFANAVRSHWHIENRLHWVLDVTFHEDLSRLRTGHGPHNMGIVRQHGDEPAALRQTRKEPQGPT